MLKFVINTINCYSFAINKITVYILYFHSSVLFCDPTRDAMYASAYFISIIFFIVLYGSLKPYTRHYSIFPPIPACCIIYNNPLTRRCLIILFLPNLTSDRWRVRQLGQLVAFLLNFWSGHFVKLISLPNVVSHSNRCTTFLDWCFLFSHIPHSSSFNLYSGSRFLSLLIVDNISY